MYGAGLFLSIIINLAILTSVSYAYCPDGDDLTNGLIDGCPTVVVDGGRSVDSLFNSGWENISILAVTSQDGDVWSAYFDDTNSVTYHYSSGKKASAIWSTPQNGLICFRFVISSGSDLTEPVCKKIQEAGRGYHWISTQTDQATSQIIHVVSGDTYNGSKSLITNINYWRGKRIYGRTIDSKKIWYIDLKKDGTFVLHSTGERTASGTYKIDTDSARLCFEFDPDNDVHCREVYQANNSFEWIDVETGRSFSEIVYVE